MSGCGILQLSPPTIAALPGGHALGATWGLKAAGCAELLRMQPNSPVPFYLPDQPHHAVSLRPRSLGGPDRGALDEQYSRIFSAHTAPVPWLARSTALNELPGVNETYPFLIEPNDPIGSKARFDKSVSTLLDADDRLGALLMPMLGAWDGDAYGAGLVSFVADTVNPVAPDEMHIAVVTGLGTRAVDMGRGAILISVDRKTGEIEFFGNKSHRHMRQLGGSDGPVISIEHYKQGKVSFFDPVAGRIKSRHIGYWEVAHDEDKTGTLVEGRFVHGFVEGKDLGLTPFGSTAMMANLISLLQYVHAELGPSQIEGAFLTNRSNYPHLYQHIQSPSLRRETRELGVANPHLISDRVLGTARFDGPLVYYFGAYESRDFFDDIRFDDPETLREIDKRFAETGYALFTDDVYSRDLMHLTPHCRFRLTRYPMNASSHAVTLTRYKLAEDPDYEGVFAMQVVLPEFDEKSKSIAGIKPDQRFPTAVVFSNASLDSNGRRMAIEVKPPYAPQRRTWRNLWGLRRTSK